MLNITEVRIKKINKGDLLAAASICIDNCFVIKEIKLLDGKNGKYISMPKRRMKNRDFRQDFSYPINNETRLQILEAIKEQYDDMIENEVKQQKVAKRLNISQVQVSRLEKKIIAKLRNHLNE